MKKSAISCSALFGFVALVEASVCFAQTGPARPLTFPATQFEEIRIHSVYFPVQGYDDNDNVQIMIGGVTPDPCYTLGPIQVDRDDVKKVITLHQMAWRRNGGLCEPGDLFEESEFNKEIMLGRLPAGDYKISYGDGVTMKNSRPMHVDHVTVDHIDNFNYARVQDLRLPRVALESQRIEIVVGGIFSAPCNELKRPLQPQRVGGDTFVILPVEVRPAVMCKSSSIKEFQETFDLGFLPAGEYLIHVRSKNGGVVQEVLTVYPHP